MVEANLLVTYDPAHTETAKSKIESLLKEVKQKVKILSCEEGQCAVRVSKPREAVKALAAICKADPSKFTVSYHWIPIDKWCSASIPSMQKVIKELAKGIKKQEKWMLNLGRHKTEFHEKDLIIKLTEVVDQPNVDLKNPAKIIKVEVIGKKAALALLTPEELLNVAKIKG